MTEIKDKQLEAKIRDRLERLGLRLSEEKDGTFYLSELIYQLLSDETLEDIGRVEEKVAKEHKVSQYEVQAKISDAISMADENVMKNFCNASQYNLKLVYDNIELIADDILIKG